jgi:hypothetical protein
MKHALALFGHCLSLFGRTAKSRAAEEQPHADQSSVDCRPVHRCEINCDRSIVAVSFIGVIALDYRPLHVGPHGPTTFGGRCPLGPARVIASVG